MEIVGPIGRIILRLGSDAKEVILKKVECNVSYHARTSWKVSQCANKCNMATERNMPPKMKTR